MEIESSYPFNKHYLEHKGETYTIYVFDRKEDDDDNEIAFIQIYRESKRFLKHKNKEKTIREKIGRDIWIERKGFQMIVSAELYWTPHAYRHIDIKIDMLDIKHNRKLIIENAVEFVVRSMINERSRWHN